MARHFWAMEKSRVRLALRGAEAVVAAAGAEPVQIGRQNSFAGCGLDSEVRQGCRPFRNHVIRFQQNHLFRSIELRSEWFHLQSVLEDCHLK